MIRKLFLLVLLTLSSMNLNAQINSVALVGESAGGWPGLTGNPGPIDVHQMTSTDGENWTLDAVTLTTSTTNGIEGVKFRANNNWIINWGAPSFPNGIGTQYGSNIMVQAGTYNVTFNSLTGEYSFVAISINDPKITASANTVCSGTAVTINVSNSSQSGFNCFTPKVIGLSNTNFGINATCKDTFENLFVTGAYSGTTNFGNITLAGIGGKDVFLVKYNSCGIQQWALRGGSTGNEDYAGVGTKSIATDAFGNIFIVGRYNQTFTFYGNNNTSFVAPYTSTGNSNHQDGYLVKINPNGEVIWGATLRGGSNDGFNGVAVDNLGNPIVTGGFNGCCPSTFAVTIYGPNGSLGVSSFGSNYATGLVVKFDANGNILWKGAVYNRDADLNRLAIDGTNNIYLVSTFRSWSNGTAAQFIDANGTNNSLYNPGIGLGFLVKLNPSGIWQWGTSYGNNGDGTSSLTNGTDVAIDENGNPWISGFYRGATATFYSTSGSTLSLPASTNDIGFIAKYSSSGVPQLINSLQQSTGSTYFSSIAISNGTVGIAGYFTGNNLGSNDMLFVKYNTNAVLQSVNTGGGSGDDQANSVISNNTGFVVSGTTGAASSIDGVSLSSAGTFLWNNYISGVSTNSFLWSTGETTASINPAPTETTTYWCDVTINGVKYRKEITITVNNTTTSPTASASQTFCASPAPTIASLSATGTGIQWFDAATGGTALVNGTTLETGTTYYASQTIGDCESSRTAVLVTITPATPPTAVAQTFCNSATVANLVAAGTAIQWYDVANGGTALSSTTALLNDTTYYASQTINGCESTRTAVTVALNDAQITASATTVCSGTAFTINASANSANSAGSNTLPTNLQNGLVGYWPFNGNANDESGNNNNGTVNGATLTTDRFGNSNGAYSFDGVNDFIQINSQTSNNQSTNYTWSLWFKSPVSDFNGSFLSSYSWFVKLGHVGRPGIFHKDEQGNQANNFYSQQYFDALPQANQWHQLILQKNSNNITIILDNINIGSVVSYGYFNFGPSFLTKIGNMYSDYYNGQIDDIGLWNRSLTPQEITQLYTQGQTTYLWSTDETTATINPTPTETTTYWCDITVNGVTCRKEITITVTPKTTPTFAEVLPVCSGATISALPTTSKNAIKGMWSPELINTTTTTYTFTPTAGQCATTTAQTITITAPKVTSAISFVAPVAALPSVTIGTQVWTNKNLDVTTYRDGTPIPQVTDSTAWANLTTGAWCYYNNDPANGAIYGKLYNWYAVAGIHDNDPNTPNKILAPLGWHVPSDSEWTTLTDFLGGEAVAGGKMKEIGTTHWLGQNTNATNSTGFTGLPGGYRDSSFFNSIGIISTWYSSSQAKDNTSTNWYRYLYYGNSKISFGFTESFGFSVRLVKD